MRPTASTLSDTSRNRPISSKRHCETFLKPLRLWEASAQPNQAVASQMFCCWHAEADYAGSRTHKRRVSGKPADNRCNSATCQCHLRTPGGKRQFQLWVRGQMEIITRKGWKERKSWTAPTPIVPVGWANLIKKKMYTYTLKNKESLLVY